MQADLRALVDDPAWLPHIYHPARDELGFAYVPREMRERVVFLDPRHMPNLPIGMAPVAELHDVIPRQVAAPHFIFHTAFCCSTLLARALEHPGVATAVREPFVLVALGQSSTMAVPAGRVRRALDVVLALLSRPLVPGERQIIKPSNTGNLIARDALELRPQAKALLLYSTLEDYLASTAGNEAARSFATTVFPLFRFLPPQAEIAAQPAGFDLYTPALVWLKQVALFGQLVRRFGADRVRTLNSATFLAHKADTLVRAAQFLELEADESLWRATAAGPLFAQHAKAPGRPFDEYERRARHDEVRTAHAHEIDAAVRWTEAIAASKSLPLTLGDTLLDDPL